MSLSSTIVPVLAAVALSSAIAFPAFAATNNKGFQQSFEGNATGENCTTTLEYYSAAIKRMNAAKDKKARAEARDDANWAIEKGFGCAWVDGV